MSDVPQPSLVRAYLLRGGLLGVALWAGYLHLQSDGALREHEAATRNKIAGLKGQLEGANRAIKEIGDLEKQETAARVKLDRWSEEREAGPTLVWFPGWLKAQLRSFGIVEAQIRLNTEVPEPGFAGFKRTCWNVNLPPQAGVRNMNAVLLAVKEIEKRDRFVKILDCSFHLGASDPQWPAGSFNVEALVRE